MMPWIGENALVGMNAVIMDGAEIGESCLIAAMSFVKAGAVIPPRSLVAGIPGRVIREVSQAELEWKNQGTEEYQELARRCKIGLEATEPLAEEEPGRARLVLSDIPPLYKAKGG